RGGVVGSLWAGVWHAPSRVELVQAGHAAQLRFVFEPDARPATDDGGLLREFVNLTHDVQEAPDLPKWDDEKLLSFARRFGPLGLCGRHEWPISHSVSFDGRRSAQCPMRIARGRDRSVVREGAESWARYSRIARAILNLLVAPDREEELERLR